MQLSHKNWSFLIMYTGKQKLPRKNCIARYETMATYLASKEITNEFINTHLE